MAFTTRTIFLNTITAQRLLTNELAPTDSSITYIFSVAEATTFYASLSELTTDLSLKLYLDGLAIKPVATSDIGGTANEALAYSVATGTSYYLRVFNKNGALSPFKLTLTPGNKPPVVSLSSRSFARNQLGSQIPVTSLFKASDPDGDTIASYRLKVIDGDGNAYFKAQGTDSIAGPLSIPASIIKDTTFTIRPGGSTSQYRISIEASDGREWSKPAIAEYKIENTAPTASYDDRIFRSDQAGKPIDFDSLFKITDTEKDTYTFLWSDQNQDKDSGYFALDGLRTDPVSSVAKDDLSRISWVPGIPGTTDEIRFVIYDQYGKSRGSLQDPSKIYLSVEEPPSLYKFDSLTGFQHVSEGRSFDFQIRKYNNLDKSTQLQYCLWAPGWNSKKQFSPAGSASQADFRQSPDFGTWSPLRFNNGRDLVNISLETLSESASQREGSETAQIWIYDEARDDGSGVSTQNPGYSCIEFQIHDSTVHVMGAMTRNLENETAVMQVGRFGAPKGTISSVQLKASTLSSLLSTKNPLTSVKGFALGASASDDDRDFQEKASGLRFEYNTDSFTGKVLVQSGKTDLFLNKDAPGTKTEVFTWQLFRDTINKGTGLLDTSAGNLIDYQYGEIVEKVPKYSLQSVSFGDLWSKAWSGFVDFLRNNGIIAAAAPASNVTGSKKVAEITEAAANVKTSPIAVAMPSLGINSNLISQAPQSILITPDGATVPASKLATTPNTLKNTAQLIGVDAGTLIGVDAGTLIGVDAGTLIGVDGSTLIGVDAGTLIGLNRGSLIGVDAGTLTGVSPQPFGSAI